MDALSLSHLTYCCATITVNFHRLDHPPFPCKGRLLPTTIRTQARWRVHPAPAVRHHIAGHPPQPHERFSSMKPATIIGILLIIFGIIGYATGGISFTHQKKIVDAGPIQISHQTQDTLPISPILSTISLVAGLGLVVVGARSN
jgi:hypothetical protein